VLGLGFGHAVGNGGGGRLGKVVGWFIRGGAGGAVLCLVTQVGVGGLGQKSRNLSHNGSVSGMDMDCG